MYHKLFNLLCNLLLMAKWKILIPSKDFRFSFPVVSIYSALKTTNRLDDINDILINNVAGLIHSRTILLNEARKKADFVVFIDDDVATKLNEDEVKEIVTKVETEKCVVTVPAPGIAGNLYILPEDIHVKLEPGTFIPIKSSGLWITFMPAINYSFHSETQYLSNGNFVFNGEDVFFYKESGLKAYAYIPKESMRHVRPMMLKLDPETKRMEIQRIEYY